MSLSLKMPHSGLAGLSRLFLAPGFSRWVEVPKKPQKAGFQPGFSTRL